MRRLALPVFALLPLFAACGGDAQPARQAERPSLTARELEDTAVAIEEFLNAGRTREAELLARKLRDSVADEDPARARVAELASRAFFAHAELEKRELASSARNALVREASAEAARAAAVTPPDPVRLRFAALLAGQSGDTAVAFDYYDRALAIAPDDLQTLLPAASLALGVGDRERATPLVARHAALAPDDGWSAALEAQLAILEGDAPRAVERASVAMSRDREALEFRLIFARALSADGRPGDAARALSALSAADRAKLPIAQALAEALRASGDLAGAARAWNAAVEAAPDSAFARAELALALARAGDRTRAAAILEGLPALEGGESERARVDEALRAMATDP